METGIYFTALVLAVGVLHLVQKVIECIHRFKAPFGKTYNSVPKVPVKRDDWYVFFHCSDLIGKPLKHPEEQNTMRETSATVRKHQKHDSRVTSVRYVI